MRGEKPVKKYSKDTKNTYYVIIMIMKMGLSMCYKILVVEDESRVRSERRSGIGLAIVKNIL